MTTTEAGPGTKVCTHCHGSGFEPDLLGQYTEPDQQALIAKLQEAGSRRAGVNRHTLAGRQALDSAYADIREHAAEAERLHLTRAAVAEAVGVSRAQLHNILTGKTAT